MNWTIRRYSSNSNSILDHDATTTGITQQFDPMKMCLGNWRMFEKESACNIKNVFKPISSSCKLHLPALKFTTTILNPLRNSLKCTLSWLLCHGGKTSCPICVTIMDARKISAPSEKYQLWLSLQHKILELVENLPASHSRLEMTEDWCFQWWLGCWAICTQIVQLSTTSSKTMWI